MAAMSLADVKRIFGVFDYDEGPNGRVIIDPRWAVDHIAHATLPMPGGTSRVALCHVLIKPSLEKAFDDLRDDGLLGFIKSYDGCWVARHIGWDNSRPLSRHSWGIAVDLNAAQMPMGSTKKWDSRITTIFNQHGFECGEKDGGLWQTTLDPMHFEVTWTGIGE